MGLSLSCLQLWLSLTWAGANAKPISECISVETTEFLFIFQDSECYCPREVILYTSLESRSS